jgi:nucleotide-binding universal stress UspA family protein
MTFTSSQVVVPMDFSGESEKAITAALGISGAADKLHLVHVLVPLDSVSPGVLLGGVTDEQRTKTVKAKLQELVAKSGADGAHVVVLIGDPGLQITDYARKINADLIVIPSHGYHGVKRLVLGSVAERVIRHTHCSVLVLRRADAD